MGDSSLESQVELTENKKKPPKMGINRDSWHKRRKTGGRKPQMHKKRKFELGRPASNTKIQPKRVHTVRTMGGNTKSRALRLDHGNFGWASEGIARQTRIVDVVYNATSNELIRTKTLVKGAIVVVDCTPFRSFYESHYSKALGRKKNHTYTDEEKAAIEKTSNCGELTKKKYTLRQKQSEVAPNLNSQFLQGKLYAKITSRPCQCGRADGVILEGEELDFYVKKLKVKKSKA